MGLGKKMSFSWKLLKWIYSVLEKSSSYTGASKKIEYHAKGLFVLFFNKKKKNSYILIAQQLKHFKSFLVLILMVMTEALFTLVRFRNYLRLLYTSGSQFQSWGPPALHILHVSLI